MAYVRYNANPDHARVGDCTVRALSLAFDTDWEDAYIRLAIHGFMQRDMPSSDIVWWDLLEKNGFSRNAIPSDCPLCTTVRQFCRDHPEGVYVLATEKHVLTAIDGDWYDTWDSGDEIVLHFWTEV